MNHFGYKILPNKKDRSFIIVYTINYSMSYVIHFVYSINDLLLYYTANDLLFLSCKILLILCPSRYKELLDRKAQLEESEESMRMEREKMERVTQGQLESEKELERLRMDNER